LVSERCVAVTLLVSTLHVTFAFVAGCVYVRYVYVAVAHITFVYVALFGTRCRCCVCCVALLPLFDLRTRLLLRCCRWYTFALHRVVDFGAHLPLLRTVRWLRLRFAVTTRTPTCGCYVPLTLPRYVCCVCLPFTFVHVSVTFTHRCTLLRVVAVALLRTRLHVSHVTFALRYVAFHVLLRCCVFAFCSFRVARLFTLRCVYARYVHFG